MDVADIDNSTTAQQHGLMHLRRRVRTTLQDKSSCGLADAAD
jgi:hypothetical protein